jgi:hypothetical protein
LTSRRAVAATAVVCLVAVAALAAVTVPRLLAQAGPVVPHFVDEAQSGGVSQAYTGDFDYYVGGGVAAFDCNGDGRPELYFAGGTSPAGLFINDSAAAGPLKFSRVADPATDLTSVTGAYPIDFDGDGMTDIAVLRNGENVVLRGTGDCHFERANEPWSFEGGDASSTAFSAKWDAGATWPTVAVGNYLSPEKPDGTYDCLDDQLYRPGRSGVGFGAPVALSPSWCSLSLLFTDWDRSGRRDLRVSNDRHYYGELSGGEEQLWRVDASSPPRQYTASDGWQTVKVWGMGIADYDVDSDGYPDYYLTSQADNKLQVLADGPSQPAYTDKALTMGVTGTRPYVGDTTLPSTAWHSEFQDVNNDGLVDLFVAKGNVEAMPDFAKDDPSDLFLGQLGGTFAEAGQQAGIDSFQRARGGAMVDLNDDGMLDLVVVDRVDNVRVYRNVGSGTAAAPQQTGNWIGLELEDAGANRDAIGAWLEVRAGAVVQQRELTIGGGHASGELTPVHFGLGQSTQAEVRITWPDGTVGEWQPVSSNEVYVIKRGAEPVSQN